MPESPPASKLSMTVLSFLAIAFAIVGLTGLFATFAAPLPLQRALARERTLDAVLLAATHPNPAAELEALRPSLDDSADAVLSKPGSSTTSDLVSRVAGERIVMRHRMEADTIHLAVRLRWLICVITMMAAAFSIAILHAGRNNAK